ncbi:MAG: carbohydrate-binding domain-containing protein [Bacteroidaceae bacterium]|nr:carbohydrate-binding domain-containing protein [Bacteroidaceae bacterium]
MQTRILLLLSLLLCFVACTKDEENTETIYAGTSGTANSQTAVATGDDLETFSVELNSAALSETESIPTDATDEGYEDYVENEETWKNNFTLTFTADDVTIEGYDETDTDFSFTKDGAHLTVVAQKKAHYILTGTSANGSLTITGEEKKAWVELAGVTLTNPTGPAIQKLTDKRMYLTSLDGTTNTLCDGTTYTDDTQKATVYSKGKLTVNGTGLLSIKSLGTDKNALHSSDYIRFRKNTNVSITATTKNGVRGVDGILVDGGVLNITVSSAAGKGLSTDGYMEVNGGRTTVITTGGGVYEDSEASACACIKTDSIFRLNAGELWLKSTGQGGKGISSDQEVYLNGGTLRVITTGTRYTYGSSSSSSGRFGGMDSSTSSANRTSAKGIKADKSLYIAGGDIAVRCTGGEGSEGIESKQAVSISGGTVQASCYDDCINAKSSLSISGGKVYAYSSNNDGIDSNGTLSIFDGVIVSSGTNTPDEGIDCDQNNFAITGGYIIGVGGASSTPTTASCTQPSIIYGGSGTQGTLITLIDGSGTHVLSYTIPRTYSQMTLLVSSPSLSKGSTYYLYTGSSLTGTTAFHGLQLSGTVSGAGSSLGSATLSNMVTTLGSVGGGMGGQTPGGGGMGGGTMPGGRW